MSINWALFLPSILLLLFPADKMFSVHVELRSFDCLSGLGRRNRRCQWWSLAGLWLDPLRGFAGAWLLIHAFDLAATSWNLMPKVGFAMAVSILVLAALSQTFTRRDSGVLLAPIGFVCGTAIALVPGYTPLFGLAMALVAMFGFRQFNAFFLVGTLAFPLFGFVFQAQVGMICAATMMFLLPLLAGMLTGSELEIPWRYSGGSG